MRAGGAPPPPPLLPSACASRRRRASVAERARPGPRALPWLARRVPSRASRLPSLLRPRPRRWVAARQARGRGGRERGGRRGLARPVPARPVPRLPGAWLRACARLGAAPGSARGPRGRVGSELTAASRGLPWRGQPGGGRSAGRPAPGARPSGGDSGVGPLRGCGSGGSGAHRRR